MENTETIDEIEQVGCRVTHSQLGEKFASLRQESSERAVQHRERLQRAAEMAKQFSKFQSAEDVAPREPKREIKRSEPTRKTIAPAVVAKPNHLENAVRQKARRDLDLIALWSVVGPSTIAAVFGGVAMSRGNVPISYALTFIFAWFVLTSGLALSALKLFNTREIANFLRSSAPRLGMAAISCALVSVLTVEVARLSITAIAAPAPQQVSTTKKSNVQSKLTIRSAVLPTLTASVAKQALSPNSVHFPTTTSVISPGIELPKLAGSTNETVVALPSPTPVISAEDPDIVEEVTAKSAPRHTKGELLGRISNKGKFLAHRGSSKWSGPVTQIAKTRRSNRRVTAPDKRNILEKIFNPVIKSANAKAPARRIRSEVENLDQISR